MSSVVVSEGSWLLRVLVRKQLCKASTNKHQFLFQRLFFVKQRPNKCIVIEGAPKKKEKSYLYIYIYIYCIVCVCVFIKLHITTQSGPVILVGLCHLHVCVWLTTQRVLKAILVGKQKKESIAIE